MFKWVLQRIWQDEKSTVGTLTNEKGPVCWAVELPWRENLSGISCIPAGTYPLTIRYTPTRKDHLLISDVPKRSGILIHIANNATELRGCIGPGLGVYDWSSSGWGVQSSALALQRILKLYREAADARVGEQVIIVLDPAKV